MNYALLCSGRTQLMTMLVFDSGASYAERGLCVFNQVISQSSGIPAFILVELAFVPVLCGTGVFGTRVVSRVLSLVAQAVEPSVRETSGFSILGGTCRDLRVFRFKVTARLGSA